MSDNETNEKDKERKIKEKIKEKVINQIFEPENFIRNMLRAAEIFFVIAAFGIVIYTIYELPSVIIQGFEPFIEIVVGNTFLLVALLEIYEGVADLEKGKGRSALDVMDAATSFLLREVIETVYEKDGGVELLLTYGALVLAIAGARLLIAHGNLVLSSKKKSGDDDDERTKRENR